MEAEWPDFIPPPPAPPPRSLGMRIAIGVGASIGIWFLVDELTEIFNGYVVAVAMVLIIGVVLFKTKSDQRSQQFWVMAILAACVVGWVLLVFLFSFFNVWIFLALTAGLGVVVLFKETKRIRRQHWLDMGCCGNCGYDLRATPDRCPECGRDTSLDEPTWRKLRREWGHIKPADEVEAVQPAQPTPVARVPVMMRTPDLEEGPIPLEGGESDDKTPADTEIRTTKFE